MPTLTSYWPTGGTFGSLPARNLNPTREAILSEKPNDIVIRHPGSNGCSERVFITHPMEEFVPELKEWAAREWRYVKAGTMQDQLSAFQHLVTLLCIRAHSRCVLLTLSQTTQDGYVRGSSPSINLILSQKPLSLITLLHELGHHFYGESELQACRFSVWLFREAFPKSYAKLEWDGHVLKRPPTC